MRSLYAVIIIYTVHNCYLCLNLLSYCIVSTIINNVYLSSARIALPDVVHVAKILLYQIEANLNVDIHYI